MSKKKQVKKVEVVNVEEVERQVVEAVMEVQAPAATHQPYNQAVDLLGKAFVFFNEKLAAGYLDVTPVITIQSKGRRSAYGWFWDCTWKNGNEAARPEINIAAEHLSRTARNIFETLIHEMAHMINAKKGIKDCNAAQYHNKQFKITAELLGLVVEKMGAYGYAKTALNEPARIVVDQFIADNDCSVFDTFNRVDHKRQWRKVWTIPCDEDSKNEVKRIALEQNITEKQVVNMLLSSYFNQAEDVMETVEA
jgi:hypothetical protein